MAFIREYAARDMGDPFSLRMPRRIRKMKVGRAIGHFARAALPVAGALVPGVGRALDFARSYGLEAGDPGAKMQKRKLAGGGPKMKAKHKSDKRALKAHKLSPSKKKKLNINWSKLGQAAAAGVPIVGNLASEILAQTTGGTGSEMDAMFGGTPEQFSIVPGKKGARGFGGGHHRTMNPLNIKALRRGLRRVEGFEKVVKRVEKLFPKMKRAHGGHGHAPRGHKAGCKCVACR